MASFFVDSAAPLGGDGSSKSPFARITDAIEAARGITGKAHGKGHEEIVVHVAPGKYVGSYSKACLDKNSKTECLPIAINVPNVRLQGRTELEQDDLGLPTAAKPGSETILTSDAPLTGEQALIVITRTKDGSVGDNVSVMGLVLDANGGRGAWADRVSGLTFKGNVVQNSFAGIAVHMTSGRIEGNLAHKTPNGTGIGVGAGSKNNPAEVFVAANRSVSNFVGLLIGGTANLLDMDFGHNSVQATPYLKVFPKSQGDDVPNQLSVTITANDLSNNSAAGLRCYMYQPQTYSTRDGRLTAEINAAVSGNRCNGNAQYGIVVDAGWTYENAQIHYKGTFSGAFGGNTLEENVCNVAYLGFNRLQVAMGKASPKDWQYAEGSTYVITDQDGELAGFDYDHPAIDPSGDPNLNLQNTLAYDGEAVPNGKHGKCVH
jgi:hypothetical protein